jgi:hypothetical protein
MNAILFFILCAQAASVIVWTLMRAERVNYFSALLAISFSGFAIPQLYGLLGSSESLPPGGLAKTLLMTNLCFAGAIIGFNLRVRPLNVLQWTCTPRALLFISALLTLIGAGCYFKITRLPEEMLNRGQWSGIVTVYNFFASALPCGLVVALYLALRKPSPAAIILVAISSLLILDRVIMGGRRSQAVILLLTVVLSLWFYKKKTIPRVLFVVFAIIGYFAVYSIADYRRAVMGEGKTYNSIFLGGGLGGFKNLSNINFLENSQRVAKEGSTEYEAAVFGIASTDENMRFDFGLSHWDTLVHHFVPAQFLGQDFKESLKFNLNRSEGSNSGYEKAGSTSEPGVVDAFRSFWYFGCLKFLLIGLLMRLLLTSALAGNLNCAFLYTIWMPSAIVIISHPIDFFLENIVHSVLLLGAAIFLVRIFQPSAILRRRLISRPSGYEGDPTTTLKPTTLVAKSRSRRLPRLVTRTIRSLPRFVANRHSHRSFGLMSRFNIQNKL